jgi:hypothetical protein
MARLIGYSYSEGPAAVASPATAAGPTSLYQSTNTLAIIEQATPGTTTYARTAAPQDFLTQLATWAASFNLTAPAGTPAGTYTATYDSTTKRVTIAGSVAFRPVFPGNVAAFLGFTQVIVGWATSWVGASAPLGIVELNGLELQVVEDAAQVELHEWRHGRSQAIVWGNLARAQAKAWFAQADAAALEAGYVLTGRVQLWPDGASGARSPTNPGGYLDGYVIEMSELEPHGESEQNLVATMLIGVAR